MLPDVGQYAAVTASSLFAVYILVQFVKAPLELVVKPSSLMHDWAIRVLACAAGVAVVVLANASLGHLATGQAWFVAVSQGIMAGLGAVGTYHLVSTADTSAVVVQAPPAQSAEPTAVVVPPASKPTVVVQPPVPAPALPPPAGDTTPTPPETPTTV